MRTCCGSTAANACCSPTQPRCFRSSRPTCADDLRATHSLLSRLTGRELRRENLPPWMVDSVQIVLFGVACGVGTDPVS
jgi:hypothetical protein